MPKEAVTPAEIPTPQVEKQANEISDREIEQYIQDQSDWSTLNRGSRQPFLRRTRRQNGRHGQHRRPRRLASRKNSTRQWDLVEVEDRIRRAGRVLIDWVGDDGYIRDPIETIAQAPPRRPHRKRSRGRHPRPPATPRTRRHLRPQPPGMPAPPNRRLGTRQAISISPSPASSSPPTCTISK